jgi:hypothetical protein
MWWTDYGNSTQCKTRTKFTISQCMVYFPDPVKINLRKPFIQMRYRKITQHKITSLVTNSKFVISQYGQIQPCDKFMCIIKLHLSITMQVITLHTVHANFNYDISAIKLSGSLPFWDHSMTGSSQKSSRNWLAHTWIRGRLFKAWLVLTVG